MAGLSAGAIGAFVGTPAELAIIRMQVDNTLAPGQRRGYKSVVDVLRRVVASEGALQLWKGSGPTIVRAMALNCGALASYDETREHVDAAIGQPGSRAGIAAACLVSGVCGAVFSLPFDYVKTQVQRGGVDGPCGAFDCAATTLREHGLMRFYAGLPTYTLRIAPMIMMTWLLLEQIQGLEKRWRL